jgi:hypothetical protein
MHRIRLLIATGLLSIACFTPAVVSAAAGPAPGESCVPGTIWEDLSSGVKYICIYDEIYGGSRWELLDAGQRGADGMVYRSSAYGCLFENVGISTLSGGGADSIARTYRWPCTRTTDRIPQPAGELRSRIVIQRYGTGGWSTCRDSGYAYNTVTAYGWVAGLDMGASADCGTGSYRALGFGSFWQGGLWRSGSLYTPYVWLP